jgi:hypothetical protein
MKTVLYAEGELAKRFRIYWCDIDNNPYDCEGEYDSTEEVRGHRFRLDRRYKIRANGKFYTRKEFEEWAKEHEHAPPSTDSSCQ